MKARDAKKIIDDTEALIVDLHSQYRDAAAKLAALYDIIEWHYNMSPVFDEDHLFWGAVKVMGWESHFPKKVDEFGL